MPSAAVAHAALAFSAVCGWVTLAVLALFPSGAWPHTGFRGNVERAILFFFVAVVTRTVVTHHETRLQILCFALAAVLFEAGRGWIAHHSNGLMGWVSSTIGAAVGASLMHFVVHMYFWRLGWGW